MSLNQQMVTARFGFRALQNQSPSFDHPVHTVDVRSPPLQMLLTPLPPVSAAVPLRPSVIEASAGWEG